MGHGCWAMSIKNFIDHSTDSKFHNCRRYLLRQWLNYCHQPPLLHSPNRLEKWLSRGHSSGLIYAAYLAAYVVSSFSSGTKTKLPLVLPFFPTGLGIQPVCYNKLPHDRTSNNESTWVFGFERPVKKKLYSLLQKPRWCHRRRLLHMSSKCEQESSDTFPCISLQILTSIWAMVLLNNIWLNSTVHSIVHPHRN